MKPTAFFFALVAIAACDASNDLSRDGGTRSDASYQVRDLGAGRDDASAALGDAATRDDAAVLEDAAVPEDAEVLEDGAARADAAADAAVDASNVDAEVDAYDDAIYAAQVAYIEQLCRCEYATLTFDDPETCEAVLAPDRVDDCTLSQYRAHWDEIEPRATCFTRILNDYAACMSAATCGTGETTACDDAYFEAFSTCGALAEERSAAIDRECA